MLYFSASMLYTYTHMQDIIRAPAWANNLWILPKSDRLEFPASYVIRLLDTYVVNLMPRDNIPLPSPLIFLSSKVLPEVKLADFNRRGKKTTLYLSKLEAPLSVRSANTLSAIEVKRKPNCLGMPTSNSQYVLPKSCTSDKSPTLELILRKEIFFKNGQFWRKKGSPPKHHRRDSNSQPIDLVVPEGG